MSELDLDKFGEIMDNFLKKNEIQMLLTIPEGSNEFHVKDNVGLGSVVHFYILLGGIGTVLEEMLRDMGIDKESEEARLIVKESLKLVEDAIFEDNT